MYFVGAALVAASLSIAAKIQVRWSASLFGIMMFLFVALIHLPGAIAAGGRILWTIVFRELSYGAGGWVVAVRSMEANGNARGKSLLAVGRVLIAITAIIFGVQHFLHPLGLPGVPLAKQMPMWIPVRPLIDYLTGTLLVAAGAWFLFAWKTRRAATYLGVWILLLVVAIYGPVLIGAFRDARTAIRVEGLNYFADTLLLGAVILSLALGTTPDRVGKPAVNARG